MKKDKVGGWQKKEIRKEREDARMRKLNAQRTSFDIRANNQPKKTFR